MAGFLSTLFGGGAEKEAADKNRALYSQYRTDGTGYLDKGLAGGVGALDQAAAAYDPLKALAAKYGGASSLLLDSYGVNGAEGNDRARAAFQTGPGYEFARDQALEAVNRRRAISGTYNSGNNDLDLLSSANGLANQEYDKFRSGLSGFVNPELSATGAAASGVAGTKGALAQLYSNDAQNRVNLAGNYTSGNAAANNSEAAGAVGGAKNLLGAGLSLASLVAGGGFGGAIGSMGSSLGGAFGFGGGPIALGGAGGPGQFRT